MGTTFINFILPNTECTPGHGPCSRQQKWDRDKLKVISWLQLLCLYLTAKTIYIENELRSKLGQLEEGACWARPWNSSVSPSPRCSLPSFTLSSLFPAFLSLCLSLSGPSSPFASGSHRWSSYITKQKGIHAASPLLVFCQGHAPSACLWIVFIGASFLYT